MDEILIGDAVLARDERDSDVMTVYDIDHTGKVYCNWLIGHTMFRRRLPSVRSLIRVERNPKRPSAQ